MLDTEEEVEAGTTSYHLFLWLVLQPQIKVNQMTFIKKIIYGENEKPVNCGDNAMIYPLGQAQIIQNRRKLFTKTENE